MPRDAGDALDPLDLETSSRSVNFLTGRPWSDVRRRWAADVLVKLPLYQNKPTLAALLASVRDRNVTVLSSATGSGKSQLTPSLLLKALTDSLGQGSWKVAVTVPKRKPTRDLAVKAAVTLDAELGREVGFAYQDAEPGSSSDVNTRLLFCTDGTLVKKVEKDADLSEFAAVIIDEAHERNERIDFLMLVLRRIAAVRPEFRVVIMSATIDPALFIDYFTVPGVTVGFVEAAGQKTYHAIRRVFMDETPKDVLKAGVEVVRGILTAKESTKGGILFFVSTERETVDGCAAFKKMCADTAVASCSNVECAGLFGKMEDAAQNAVTQLVIHPYERKLVFATNLAESSVTVQGLDYVIDSGRVFSVEWQPAANGKKMGGQYASQAEITQRIGRVGRIGPGVAFMLYTKQFFEGLKQYPDPKIRTVDLTETLLTQMYLGHSLLDTIEYLSQLITPPSTEQVAAAMSILHFYGMIDVTTHEGQGQVPFDAVRYRDLVRSPSPDDDHDYSRIRKYDGKINVHGAVVKRACSEFKLDPWNALLAVSGAMFGCDVDALLMALLLQHSRGDLRRIFDPKARLVGVSADPSSDHATLLEVFRARDRNPDAVNRAVCAEVHERMGRDVWRLRNRAVLAQDFLWCKEHCPQYKVSSGNHLRDAVTAARGYHACSPASISGGKQHGKPHAHGKQHAHGKPYARYRNVYPARTTDASLSPVFASTAKDGARCVYEWYTDGDRGRDFKMITRLADRRRGAT